MKEDFSATHMFNLAKAKQPMVEILNEIRHAAEEGRFEIEYFSTNKEILDKLKQKGFRVSPKNGSYTINGVHTEWMISWDLDEKIQTSPQYANDLDKKLQTS